MKKWKAFIGDEKRVSNDPMEAHVIGFNMWVKAVEKAGTTDADKVIDSIVGIEVPNLTGGVSKMLPNHHITKPVLIGEIQEDGQFEVVWQTEGLVPGDAWSDHLPGSKDLKADWVDLKCGNYNTENQEVRWRRQLTGVAFGAGCVRHPPECQKVAGGREGVASCQLMAWNVGEERIPFVTAWDGFLTSLRFGR